MERATMNRVKRCVAACLILVVGCATTVFAEDITGTTPSPQDLSSAVLAPDVQEIGQEEQTTTQSTEAMETVTPAMVEATPVPIHRVTFYDLYGNEYAWADVPDGNHVIEPDKPVIPGYDFKYWYDETSELHEPYPFGDPVTRDINLWPLLTVAATQQEVVPDMDGGTEVPEEKNPEELAQEILQAAPGDVTVEEEPEPTLSQAPAVIMTEEEAQQLTQDILSTQPPVETEPTASGETAQDILGMPASSAAPEISNEAAQDILGEPVSSAAPETTGETADILATTAPETAPPSPEPTASGAGTIANILGGAIPSPDETEQPIDERAKIAEIAGGQEATADATQAPTDEVTPAAETTLAPNVQYTIDLIESILQNPARTAEPEATALETSSPVTAETQDIETSAPGDAGEGIEPEQTMEPGAETTASDEQTAEPQETVKAESSPTPTEGVIQEPPVTETTAPAAMPQILEPTPFLEALPTDVADAGVELDKAQEPVDLEEMPVVTISSASADEVIGIGSTITLTSQVSGVPAGTMLVYQWQNDASGAYENVSGATGSTYTYVVDETTSNCDWRVQVQVIMG